MNCPICGKEMWDNREKKLTPKAPDYKCKDKNCKYEFDKISNEWVAGEYVTAIWLPKGTPKDAKFTAKPTEPKKSLLKEYDNVVKPEEVIKEKELIKETEQEMWANKERREHKRALTMQAFGLFVPRNNEDNTTPMDRWTAIRDMRDIMLEDLYNDGVSPF
jgi:hypothetical protein